MAIQRWSPFADLRRVEDVFNRMWASREAYEPEAWRIPLDVTKDNDNIVVTASLPGVTADQIEAKVDDGVLTIRAEVTNESDDTEGGYLLRERRSGTFYRSVRLPESVDGGKAESTYKDGVLTITFPQAESKKPKRLSIHAA